MGVEVDVVVVLMDCEGERRRNLGKLKRDSLSEGEN